MDVEGRSTITGLRHPPPGGGVGFKAGVTVAENDLSFLSDFLGDAHVGKATYAYVVDPKGKVFATSSKRPDIARDLSALPQVAVLMAPGGKPHASGTDADGHSVSLRRANLLRGELHK
jgi:hypothetical protein